jgi:hypothetical protein
MGGAVTATPLSNAEHAWIVKQSDRNKLKTVVESIPDVASMVYLIMRLLYYVL